jgi:drug/metabolite transporter (DMT)-like permease
MATARKQSHPSQASKAESEAHSINRTMTARDWAILLFLGAVWGASFFFIKVAVLHMPPLTYVWLRVMIAAAALWLFLFARGELKAVPGRAVRDLLILALINNVIPFALVGWAEMRIPSGLASILNATTPIWGVVVAHLFTRDEPLTRRSLSGVLLGFAGVVLMIGPGLLKDLGGDVIAEFACLLSTLGYALSGVWARRFKPMGISPIAVTTGQLTASAIVILPIAFFVDRPWALPFPPLEAWGAVLALSLVGTAYAYILYFRLIGRAGATNALLVTLLSPPFAILLGTLVFGEVLANRDFAGLALIAVGLAVIDGRLFNALQRPFGLRRAT